MSNRPHHRPDEQPAIPAHLQKVADTLNAWHETFAQLRPGPVSFRVDVVDVMHGGKPETGVQVWVILPTGPTVVTVPPDLADELAKLLTERAREARSGIVAARRLETNGAHRL